MYGKNNDYPIGTKFYLNRGMGVEAVIVQKLDMFHDLSAMPLHFLCHKLIPSDNPDGHGEELIGAIVLQEPENGEEFGKALEDQNGNLWILKE